MKTIRFLVTGRSSLLMNSPKAMKVPGGPSATKAVPTPAVEAENGTYRNEDGTLYFPAMAFRRAMEAAAKGYKAGKRGLPQVIRSVVFTSGETMEKVDLHYPKTLKPLKTYTINTQRCCVGSGGRSVAVMRSRPLVESWGCYIEFEYDDEMIDEATITKTFARAGLMVGIGNFSPFRGGFYGRFNVEVAK